MVTLRAMEFVIVDEEDASPSALLVQMAIQATNDVNKVKPKRIAKNADFGANLYRIDVLSQSFIVY
jgi:hypothetical protein